MQANDNVVVDGSMHFQNGTDLDCDTMKIEEGAPARVGGENDATYIKTKGPHKAMDDIDF